MTLEQTSSYAITKSAIESDDPLSARLVSECMDLRIRLVELAAGEDDEGVSEHWVAGGRPRRVEIQAQHVGRTRAPEGRACPHR